MTNIDALTDSELRAHSVRARGARKVYAQLTLRARQFRLAGNIARACELEAQAEAAYRGIGRKW